MANPMQANILGRVVIAQDGVKIKTGKILAHRARTKENRSFTAKRVVRAHGSGEKER